MNISELRTAWQQYDRKIQSAQAINEKIIISMITERSKSSWSNVKRQYILGLIWMVCCLFIGGAILIGNPFDYKYTWQYLPIVIYTLCLFIGFISMLRDYLNLKDVDINRNNLSEALNRIIAIYEKPKRFLKFNLWLLIFASGFLFPFSFLPKNIERYGVWVALGERLIPIVIFVVLFLAAKKMGAFDSPNKVKFKEHLNELEELKSMSAELDSIN